MSKSSQLLVTLCFLLYFTTIVEAQVICPTDWTVSEETGSCVRVFTDGELMWYEAQYACMREGGDLVKIVNQNMNNLFSGFDSENQNQIYGWIGLNSLLEVNVWVWSVDDSPAEWTNWMYMQPDSGGSQQCAVIDYEEAGQWRDLGCDYSSDMSYICEIFPTPTTTTLETTTTVPNTTTTVPTTKAAATPTPVGPTTESAKEAIITTSTIRPPATATTIVFGNTTTNASPDPSATSGGLSVAAVIGIVIACLLVILIPVLFFVWRVCFQGRRRAKGGSSALGMRRIF